MTKRGTMPDLRQDPIAGRWVIIAENRAARPNAFSAPSQSSPGECPFCTGREALTPEPVAVYHDDSNDQSWRVRVFPNKYPAVTLAGDPASAASGSHEVIVESPDHLVSFSEVAENDARLSFRAYQDRLLALRQDDQLGHALVFKNARTDGGASLEHTHSQLIATNSVPPQVQFELARAGEYRALHGQCVFCEMIAEAVDSDRIVCTSEHFIGFCPYASRFPFETWIIPKEHRASFEDATHAELNELAGLTQTLIRQLESFLEIPAYNFWIRTAPFALSVHDDYHWHLELMPRMIRMAGFELATGCFINPVSPERAAGQLRLS